MSAKLLNLFFKFSGFIFSAKEKLIAGNRWYKILFWSFIIFISELFLAIVSLPLYCAVRPKKLQQEGTIFPAAQREKDQLRVYTIRRKISLTTIFGSGGLFLFKVFLVGIISSFLIGGQILLAATQSWNFDTAGNYTYDSAKIEVTSGVARLKNLGSTTSGSTTNSGFDSNSTGWTYADWGQGGGEVNVTGARQASDGNPGGWINVSFPAGSDDELGGYWRQGFTTTAANPITTVSFDWQVSAYDSTPAPITFKLYAFVDTGTGVPVIGQEVWSSGEITATRSWTSVANLDVSSKVTAAGTYYLKVAVWLETPGSSTGPFTIGYDNVIANWSKTTISYATDSPTIKPTTSLNPANVKAWNSFAETATKNGGSINYQLSDDDGATWKYWNGSAWAAAVGAADYNSATVVNTNISSFPVAAKKIMWRAFLTSNGTQQVILDNLDIGYTENDLPDALNLAASQSSSDGMVYINYNLQDNESDTSSLTAYEYSLTGVFAGEEATMTPDSLNPIHDGVSGLTTSPGGVNHDFVWDALTDLGNTYNGTVYVRLQANDGIGNGAYAASSSFVVDLALPVVSSVTAAQTAGAANVVITYNFRV